MKIQFDPIKFDASFPEQIPKISLGKIWTSAYQGAY